MANKAKNLKSIFFIAPEGIGTLKAQTNYGVINSKGMTLSSDGVSPSVWHSMKTAKEIALHCDGFEGYSWINIYPSTDHAKAARDN